jgi:phosphomannomutase
MDLTPQEAFLELGFITEEFMEIYAYAHVKQLISSGTIRAGDNFIIGWDPRNPKGDFTSAVVSGVCKAEVNALILGVVPTPLVPMYMLYKNASGGFMVTASHNPKDQNGIKIFDSFKGFKYLPENDLTLTRAVLETQSSKIRELALKGKRTNSRKEALKLFDQFSTAPKNTWAPFGSHLFKNIILVVDAANGSLSEIAEKIFNQVGFRKVINVNCKLNGDVNLKSGVAELEGKTIITRAMIQKGTGIFSEYAAITELMRLGQKNKTAVTNGKLKICGAVFDADGDRFYRLEYDPFKDALIVINGDDAAFFQAKYLMTSNPKRYKGSRYINTIESDISSTVAAKKMGFKPVLTPVGDKWILLKIATLLIEKRINATKKSRHEKTLPSKIQKIWANIQKKPILDILKLEELESELDQSRIINKTEKPISGNIEKDLLSFAIGSEESGHSITEGFLTCEDGREISVFLGNGLKSAINTFTATQTLLDSKPKTYFTTLRSPFPPGYKQTFYIYYIKKHLYYKNSLLWEQLKKFIYKEARDKGFNPSVINFGEEPDLLYISLTSKLKNHAAIFIRNSGTEKKIGVYLRGSSSETKKLEPIGQKCVKLLLSSMKDCENNLHLLEQDIFKQLSSGPTIRTKLKLKKPLGDRVLSEMVKQNLIELTKKGYALTNLGEWYQSTQSMSN